MLPRRTKLDQRTFCYLRLSLLKTSFSFQRLKLPPIENSLLPDDVGPRFSFSDASKLRAITFRNFSSNYSHSDTSSKSWSDPAVVGRGPCC